MADFERDSDTLSSEEATLLASEKDEFELKRPSKSRFGRSMLTKAVFYTFHLLFLIINVLWAFTNLHYRNTDSTGHGTPYEPWDAPLQEQYSQYQLPLGEKSVYTTFDRSVADPAWHSISMKDGLGWLKVPQEKVEAMDQSSVQFHDRSGYFFGMDVFHQLHCLNYLRKKTVLYNHLYPSETEVEDQQVPPEFHIPHCIDSIRLSLQCHADVSLIPQRWADGWLEPWAVWTNKHVCRDFDAIRDWAAESVPDLSNTLRHPELGTVVSGRLNLSALPIWQEAHDENVVLGQMPVCHSHSVQAE